MVYKFPCSGLDFLNGYDNKFTFCLKLSRNQIDDQTKESMAKGLSELVTVQKLWSTVVLVRFRNCF